MSDILSEMRAANADLPLPHPAAQISPAQPPPAGQAPPGTSAAASRPSTAPSSPSGPPAPTTPHSCGFATYWLDAYNHWHCESCQPPRFAFQVRRRATVVAAGLIDEITAADEQRYSDFIEVRAACGRRILTHKNFSDPRSDYFNPKILRAIEVGWETAEREADDQHAYLSEVLARTGTIDRLPI